MVIFHALNNLDSHFRPHFAILSHDAREKEKLTPLSELTKTLEDEQMRLSNENRETANYACSSKPKKAKLSEQVRRGEANKRFDNKGEIKWQEVKKYKTGKSKYKKNCCQLKTKYFICHKAGHFAAECPENYSSGLFFSCNTQTKKQLYYSQKIARHPNSKAQVD